MPPKKKKELKLPERDCVKSYSCTSDLGKKLFMTLLGVFMVYAIFYIGTLIRNSIEDYNYIGQAPKMEKTIAIAGIGKVVGGNDVAVTTLGYFNVDEDVAKAQEVNEEVMGKIMADLDEMGIEEKDLQSNYSIYPEYEYLPEEGRQFKGYRVNSQVTVKIRDLEKIENVLALAGKYGANQVSGLSFTIDDRENLKDEARDKAILDAKQKASYLSEKLGMRLGKIISYNEYENGNYGYPEFNKVMMDGSVAGLGGGGMADVSAGSQDVSINVNLVFELL